MKPPGELEGFLKSSYRSFLPAALELGVTTEEESAAFCADMDEAIASGPSSYVLGPLVVGAWKRKRLRPEEG